MDFKDDNFVCFGKLFLNRRDVLHPILPNKKKTKPKIKKIKTPTTHGKDHSTSNHMLLYSISGTNRDFHGKWLLKNPGRLPRSPVTHILLSLGRCLKSPKETKGD